MASLGRSLSPHTPSSPRRPKPPPSYAVPATRDDAIHTALLTMREGFEGEMTEHTIEVGIVGEDRVFRVLTPAEVKDFLDEST